jgi:hypothetical protein
MKTLKPGTLIDGRLESCYGSFMGIWEVTNRVDEDTYDCVCLNPMGSDFTRGMYLIWGISRSSVIPKGLGYRENFARYADARVHAYLYRDLELNEDFALMYSRIKHPQVASRKLITDGHGEVYIKLSKRFPKYRLPKSFHDLVVSLVINQEHCPEVTI